MAPVFNLQAMLEAEAEKLRMKVEEASLMAAKAAEEAEEKVKMIAQEAMKESGANAMDEEEVEQIVSLLELVSKELNHYGAIMSFFQDMASGTLTDGK